MKIRIITIKEISLLDGKEKRKKKQKKKKKDNTQYDKEQDEKG